MTPDNVRKVFKEHVKSFFGPRLLPNWEGRLPIRDVGRLE